MPPPASRDSRASCYALLGYSPNLTIIVSTYQDKSDERISILFIVEIMSSTTVKHRCPDLSIRGPTNFQESAKFEWVARIRYSISRSQWISILQLLRVFNCHISNMYHRLEVSDIVERYDVV